MILPLQHTGNQDENGDVARIKSVFCFIFPPDLQIVTVHKNVVLHQGQKHRPFSKQALHPSPSSLKFHDQRNMKIKRVRRVKHRNKLGDEQLDGSLVLIPTKTHEVFVAKPPRRIRNRDSFWFIPWVANTKFQCDICLPSIHGRPPYSVACTRACVTITWFRPSSVTEHELVVVPLIREVGDEERGSADLVRSVMHA